MTSRNEYLASAVLPVLLGFSGCAAYYVPPAPGASTPALPDRSLADLRVRVFAAAPDMTSIYARVLTPQELADNAAGDAKYAADKLRATGAFASVEVAADGSEEGVVRVEPVPSEATGYCDGQDILLPFLTLGIIPAECTSDRGLALGFLDRKLPAFRCPWKETNVVGLAATFAVAFGRKGWTREHDQERLTRRLRECIAEQADAFKFAAPGR